MSDKKQQTVLNILLIFVLLQPIFDILSRLAILDFIPNISTYIKPLFVFGLGAFLLFKYSPFKKKWITYIIVFALFTLGHLFLLYQLLLGKSLILHEFRFIINIAYMIALCISLFTLYHWCNDKEKMLRKIKYTSVITFSIYFALFILAVITGTSGMTYEYSDPNKLGFKGWYDSAQILGHAFSILFPIILYVILKPKTPKIIRFIFLALAVLFVSLLGTKVPYFIVLIVLVLYIILLIFFKIINKDSISSKYNIFLVIIAILSMIGTYQFTPVAYNTNINNINAQIELSMYNLDDISGKNREVDYEKLMKDNPNADLSFVKKYYQCTKDASGYLTEQFYNGSVHPSDTRSKQLVYSYKMFEYSDIQYKLLGIGYLNQTNFLALERDFFMAIFNFGILGFILFLGIPIWVFVKSAVFSIKNIKKIDLEMCMLFMGLGIFFCISIYAGYTYIYTNFSIFLALLMTMVLLKMDIITKDKNKPIQNVNFLVLHLNYGGIESSTVNNANALSEDYKVKIISFYHFKDDLSKKLNKGIEVEYLYEGVPNKEEFLNYLHTKHFIKAFKEGIKSFSILRKKKTLVAKRIRKIKEGAIVSTRVEFNTLLSKYGNPNVLKIAQEHCYHNNNRKYINQIANKYHNIDYLCALTTTLYDDYQKFLKYNNHTKVVLLPNMLYTLPNKQSKLDKNNFITIGRLVTGKKVDEIITNFSKLGNKKSQLFVVGSGDEETNLKALISDLKLEKQVKMLGYLDHQQMEKYLLNSSCFLMASVTEGLPMVLLEAMSYGIPCIVYKTASGTGDIVNDGINGYIIDNRDAELYVKDMKQIIEDKALRNKMGENAITTSKKFYKTEILKIWKKILERKI